MPPPGLPGAPLSFFGLSATMASVVIRSPAIDAAFCSAARTTLVGLMMPLVTRLTYSPVWGVEAVRVLVLIKNLASLVRQFFILCRLHHCSSCGLALAGFGAAQSFPGAYQALHRGAA